MAPTRVEKSILKVKIPFVGKMKLTSHRKKHTGVKSRQLISHTVRKPHKCSQCDKKFSRSDYLKSHIKTHTKENFICGQCGKSFIKKSELIMHHREHIGEKPYRCIHCEDSFSLKCNLEDHVRKCTEKNKEKPYQCKHCDKAFTQNALLIAHQQIHTGERPFKCSWCEKAYRDRSGLILHLKLHTGEKPHKCTYCNWAFTKKSHLKRHINIHTLEKLYPCSQCNSTFLQNINLKKHMRIHTEQKESNESSHMETTNQDTSITNSVSPKIIHITHLKTHTSSLGVWLGRVKQCHNKSSECNINQKPESAGNNISDEFSTSDQPSIPLFCDDPTEVLLWFQQNKLLKSVWSCDSCCNLMNWSKSSRSRDAFEWICQTKGCTKYQQSECIILGSFFYNSRVTLPNWFDIMFLWSENVKAKVTSKLVDISYTQINDCYASFREVCQVYLIENPIKLGGPGITIEIDVATFSGNSKPNEINPPIMVLGIIDSNSRPLKGYMEIVESNDAATLLPILLNVVEPGSIIYSKDSKEYQKAQGIREMDTTLKHSVDFLDIESEQVLKFELFWEIHNTHINDIQGCKQEYQNSYLQELMWRDRFYDDSFKSLCQHITAQYPL